MSRAKLPGGGLGSYPWTRVRSRTVSFAVIPVSTRTVGDFHRGLCVADVLRIVHDIRGYPAILKEFSDGGQVVERRSWR